MRVSRSGGWTSVIRPHSKRLRSRSSSASSRLGGRSEVITICLLALCSVLKVWKNSSCVCFLPSQELDVVDEQHVDLAVAALERLAALSSRIALMNSLVNSSLEHVAHPRPRVEAAHVVADRVQQVGLAQPGVAVDEQRVVGLARRLGDRDGGRVREPVGRADDEGLEDVLRVEPGLERRWRVGACPAALARRRRHVDKSACRLESACALSPVGGCAASSSSSVGAAVVELRVDRDRDPDLLAEGVGQRVLEAGAQPALELGAGEVVGDRDDRGVSCRVTGSLERSQARWLGCRSSTRLRHDLRSRSPAASAGRSTAPSLFVDAGRPDPSFVRGGPAAVRPIVHNFVHRL